MPKKKRTKRKSLNLRKEEKDTRKKTLQPSDYPITQMEKELNQKTKNAKDAPNATSKPAESAPNSASTAEQALQKQIEELQKSNEQLAAANQQFEKELEKKTGLGDRAQTGSQGLESGTPAGGTPTNPYGSANAPPTGEDSGMMGTMVKAFFESMRGGGGGGGPSEVEKNITTQATSMVLNGLQLQNKLLETLMFEKLGLTPVTRRTSVKTWYGPEKK